MFRRIASVVLLSLAGCNSTRVGRPVDPNAPLRDKLAAFRAPELSISQGAWLNVDRPLRFSDELNGRVVLLTFWTTSSISSTQTLRTLAALEARFRDRPFTLVGVHTGKFDAERDPHLVRAAMARAGVAFPVVMDNDSFLWAAYGAKGWPTLALIDTEGFVAAMEGGQPDGRVLEIAIENLLLDGERRGVLAKTPATWKAEPPSVPPGPLAFPSKIAALDSTRFAVSDTAHHRVLVFTVQGQLLHVIGSGRRGLADGPLETAAFDSPQGLAGENDVLFVADSGNHAVRRVDLTHKRVTTIAGTGELGRGQRQLKGPGPLVALRSPWDVALAGDFLLIATAGSNRLHRFSLSKGTVEPWVGTGLEELTDGPPEKATFARPSAVATAGQYALVADAGNSAVRQVHLATGETATLVGQGLFIFGDVDGKREDARLQYPLGVAALGEAVFVADTFNGKVKRVDQDGAVTTVASGLSRPAGLAAVGGRLLVADTDAHRLLWVDPSTGALEALTVSDVPPPAGGVVRPTFALEPARLRRTVSTLRLVLPAPPNERFTAATPVLVKVHGSAATLRAAATWTTSDDEVQLTLPLDVTGPGEIAVEVDLYARPGTEQYTKLHRALFIVPIVLSDDAKDVVIVPAHIK
jgi:hypothetical protein